MPNRTATRPCVGDAPRLLLAVAARTVLWSVLLVAVWAAAARGVRVAGHHRRVRLDGTRHPGR